MSEYEQQAIDFLSSCNATMQFYYLKKEVHPFWGDGVIRNKYDIHLTTPKGHMVFNFWTGALCEQPTEYDVLTCLTKYEPESMWDFMDEMGYEIKNGSDLKRFIGTYMAVLQEYHDLCRIFTPEQMEMLREIQ